MEEITDLIQEALLDALAVELELFLLEQEEEEELKQAA